MNMTRDEIENMSSGREMDALIAERVLGLKVDYEFEGFGGLRVPSLVDKYDEWGYLPDYSTDISAVWQVIEKLKEHKPLLNYDPYSKKWYMCFNGAPFYSAETAPLAICRAALLTRL